MEPQSGRSFVGIPGAIIIAAAIIGIAIIWTQQKPAVPAPAATGNSQPALPQIGLKPVSASDHIYGNPNAPIRIVEYSDPSCPYCKLFNPIMEQVMSQYGPSGKVAWIYRQFPLDKPDQNGNVLHPLAGIQAEGFECAASLGGNTTFWAYEKEWFDTFPSDGADEGQTMDASQMSQVAKDVGLNVSAFDSCVASNQFKDKIDAEYTDGVNAGVNGTPYIVVITPTGSTIPLSGAQTLATMQQVISTLMTEVPSASGASTTASQ